MPTYNFRYLNRSTAQPGDAEAVGQLLSQLMREEGWDEAPLSVSQRTLEDIERSSSELFIARDENGRIVGMATLCINCTPRGIVGSIEDVAVDPALREEGIENRLVGDLISRARQRKATYMKGVCPSSYVSLNLLYESLGFKKRGTNDWTLRF